MPLLADRPTTTTTIPRPRQHHDDHTPDPHAWVSELSNMEQALALALSDMPASQTERTAALGKLLPPILPTRPGGPVVPPRLTEQGVRVLNAWIAQGVARSGGEVALWQDANLCHSLNLSEGWKTPRGRALARRYGGKRRINTAESQARHAVCDGPPVELRVPLRKEFTAVHDRLAGRYPAGTPDPVRGRVYRMRTRQAVLLARAFDRDLIRESSIALALA
ncbi:hypothetical protein [Nocardiopsis sp. CNT312]|uniref:hypothetical protein n=1 Tax=Nocardiopsis sp. CNT312 TaxID=1137268 RepID=UPI00048C08A6|nr:hypothetical protein [Nocardiopsis sp. CNT312]